MKACKYCGVEVENTKKKCPNCGSTELLRVCDNCGEHFDGNFCPKCGVKVGQKEKTCPECKTVYYTNACPNCGYTPTRKAPAEQTVVHNHVYVSAPQTKSTPVTKAAPKKPEKKKGKKHRLLKSRLSRGKRRSSRIMFPVKGVIHDACCYWKDFCFYGPVM